MGILDQLTTGDPATTSGNRTSTTTNPAWYQDLIRGVAARGVGNASRPYTPYGGNRVAGWAPDHVTALNRTRSMTGAFDAPIEAGINAYSNLPGQVAPTYQAAGAAGMNAVDEIGPASSWIENDNAKKYMSPYTSSVVNEIGRVGTRNLSENLLPAVNSSFVGGGGFGSTRNAEILARTMREAGSDILGQQARSMESGYGTAANIFGADANRAQQTGNLRANAMLQGANTGLNAAQGWEGAIDKSARGMGALSEIGQRLSNTDTDRLIGVGDRQQQQGQRQLDVDYQDFLGARDWDQGQLKGLADLLKGIQIPSANVTTDSSSSMPAGQSPLAWISALAALFQNK